MFAWNGYTMAFSPFSFGPIAATFLENSYLIYFFNQLTLFTSLIIAIQYRFIKVFACITEDHFAFTNHHPSAFGIVRRVVQPDSRRRNAA
ncbi:hypothetical protein [Planococcus sp. MB-3u-03]|uniref:hypothetical protein n=1 Tax=Planococcus sp. MB-3u-03 TaxID=2058136 RepID=UPI001E43763C|nr:hypothetical protein [Planococcus sp. MB-3u-03]